MWRHGLSEDKRDFNLLNDPCKDLIPHSEPCRSETYLLLCSISKFFKIGDIFFKRFLEIGPTNLSYKSPDLGKP